MVHKTLVESILSYGTIAWRGTSKSGLNRLQISQNNILRIILNKNHEYLVEHLCSEFVVFSIKKFF